MMTTMNRCFLGALANGPVISIASFVQGSVGRGMTAGGGRIDFAFFPVAEHSLHLWVKDLTSSVPPGQKYESVYSSNMRVEPG